MSEKQYIAKVVTRTPRPRSKRLREAGIGSTASASVIISSISGASGGSSNNADWHTHTNLDTLEQISTDADGYEYLTQYKSSTDEEGNEVLVKVTEKVKAGYADKAHTLDEDSPIIGMFLSKVHADTAAGKITFAAGLDAGEAAIDAGGNVTAKSVALANGSAAIDSDGNAEMASAVVRGALKTKTASISESMGSEGYVAGFSGKGWNMRMSGGLSYLDLDNLTLRGSMTVYELLIKQIRATNGGIVVSAANARVKKVDGTDSIAHLPGDTVKVWYEQGNPFKASDWVRCMKWDTTHNRMHQYWAKVKAIGTDATYGDYTEFDYASFDTYKGGSGPAAIERLDIPRVGDEAVLFGSTVSGRQGVIYITAAEDEPPCIEVLEGVTTNSIEGVQRTRLGSLKQMSDTAFDGLLGGSGLYSDNAYLKGRFFLSNKGEEVDAFVSRVSNEQATQTQSLIKQTADSIEAKVNETGIDIENKTITLTADKTFIKAPDGTVIAAFTDGKLQRAFLDLGNLELTSEAVPTIDNFEWTAAYNTNGTLNDVNDNSTVVAVDILEDFTVGIGAKYVASGLSDGDLVAVNAGITFNPSNTTTVKNVVITATVNGEAADYDDSNEQVLFTYKDGTSTYDIQVSITFTLQGKRYSYAGDTIIAIPQTEYNAFIRGWNGTANNVKVYHNPSVAAYNNRTIIGSNGMVSYWGGRYLFHQSVPMGEGDTSESGVTIIAGRNGWKITDNGILISNNGGLDWHPA